MTVPEWMPIWSQKSGFQYIAFPLALTLILRILRFAFQTVNLVCHRLTCICHSLPQLEKRNSTVRIFQLNGKPSILFASHTKHIKLTVRYRILLWSSGKYLVSIARGIGFESVYVLMSFLESHPFVVIFIVSLFLNISFLLSLFNYYFFQEE